MPTFLAPIDLMQNELRGARVQNLASAPSNPVAGQIYFNTTLSKTFTYSGTAWEANSGATGAAGGELSGTYPNPTVASGVIDDDNISGTAAIALSKLATDPLARANHTGTQLAATVSDFDAAVRFSSVDQLTVPATDVNFNSVKLTFLGEPVAGTDAATKAYVDTATTPGTAGGDLSGTYPNPQIAVGIIDDANISATAAIALSKLATDPLARANHTGTQLAATVSDLDTTVQGYSLDLFADAAADVSLNGFKLTNLASPVSADDAATKAYVDASALGLDVKKSVRAATTGSITLSGLQSFDGVSLVDGDRVLVKDQATASTNGLYVVHAGAWTRTDDADANDEVNPGLYTFVEEGAENEDSGWLLTTDGTVALGTTDLVFTQFSGAGQITAGAGLTKTGNSLDIGGTLNRISVSADGVDISTSYIGQDTITTLGTITAGTFEGTPVDVSHGGTGAATAPAARVALGAVGTYSAPNGGTTTDVLTHGLNTLNVNVSIRFVATGEPVVADVLIVDANTVSVGYGVAPAASSLVITVIG